MADADFVGDLHLRFPLVETQGQDAAFPLAQAFERLLQGNFFQPAVIGVAAVADLVHDADGIAAVLVDRVVEAHRLHNGIHGKDHVLPRDIQRLGDLLHGWFLLCLGHELLPGLHNLVGGVPHAAADPDAAVVPEIAADFTDDHGDAIGGKADRLVQVKAVDGLDQPHTAHLEQVIRIFAAVGELLDHGQHQSEIPIDEPFPGFHIPLLGAPQQGDGLLVAQHFQFGGVYSTDLHLTQHLPISSLLLGEVFPPSNGNIRRQKGRFCRLERIFWQMGMNKNISFVFSLKTFVHNRKEEREIEVFLVQKCQWNSCRNMV